jgi:hypothetical protein
VYVTVCEGKAVRVGRKKGVQYLTDLSNFFQVREKILKLCD